MRKRGVEIRRARRRSYAASRPPSTASRSRSIQPVSVCARVLSAARFTTRRELISAIVSISTSPFAFSVLPVETRSTIRRHNPRVGRQFHRPVQLDAFRLDSAARKMALGEVRILGRDTHMAPARGIVHRDQRLRRGDGKPALADLEVERRIELGIVELHDHVAARNAEMGGTEGDEGRHVERPHAHDLDARLGRREAQLPRFRIVERRLGLDARMGPAAA